MYIFVNFYVQVFVYAWPLALINEFSIGLEWNHLKEMIPNCRIIPICTYN